MRTSVMRGGGMLPTSEHTVKSGQTLVEGDFVTLDSNGELSAATASSAKLYGRYSPAYTGALTPGLAGIVTLAKPEVEFDIKGTGAATVGSTYDLVVVSGEMRLDHDASDMDVFLVTEVLDATNFIYRVMIPTAKSQAMSGL